MKKLVILLVFLFLYIFFRILVKKIEKKLLYQPIQCSNYNLVILNTDQVENVENKDVKDKDVKDKDVKDKVKIKIKCSIIDNKHVFFQYPREKKKNEQNLIVFCHGNAGNINMYSHFIHRLVQEQMFDVLVPEYPEFGIVVDKNKEKKLNRRNCIQNVLDAFFKIQNEKNNNGIDTKKSKYQNVYFFGFSLGTSIATQCVRLLHKDTSIRGLVLINGFSSYENLMEDIVGKFYTKLLPLSFEDFNTRKYAEELVILKQKDFKVCLVHTMKDSLIPWKHSKILFDAFEGVHRKHILIRQGDHNLGPVQFFEEWFPSTALFLLN